MDWRSGVTSLSDKVFPGLNHKVIDEDDDNLAASEVLSNLPLQMALYFNAILAPIWVLIIIIFLANKFDSFDELHKFIVITVIVAILIIEPLRLYLGYEGNLRDKIPELAGFWMLSLLLQLPLQSFLLTNPYFRLQVTEIVIQSVMVLLLMAQTVFGYFSLKYTAAQQALYFKIMKSTRDTYQLVGY